jgi:hypothetical protein
MSLKSWWKEKQFQRSKAVLLKLIEKKDEKIYKEIRTLGKIMAMKELDLQRINHCSVCPAIAPLKKFADNYFCAPHCPKLDVAA